MSWVSHIKFHFVIVILFGWFWCIPAFSLNNYQIDEISSTQGLPSDDVRDVFQDSQGFLWFCTNEGLIRYDGYVLKTFSIEEYHDKGLITNTFFEIEEDSKGHLWCATDRGVARLNRDKGSFSFYNTDSSEPYTLSHDVVNTIAIDAHDDIWIGSSGYGVDVLSPEVGIIEEYTISTTGSLLNSNWITNIYRDREDNMWISSWEGGLTLVDIERGIVKSWSQSDLPFEVSDFSPFSMVQSPDGEYWAGLWGEGLINFSLDDDSLVLQKRLLFAEPLDPENIIFDLTFDADSNLWVGAPTGLTKVTHPKSDDPAFLHFRIDTRHGQLSHNEAYSLFRDDSGLIWVGTSGGGVNKIDNQTKLFEPYFIPDDSNLLGSQSVSAFTVDQNNDLLVGVKSRGFGKYNLNDSSFHHYLELPVFRSLPDNLNTVNCFHWDQHGILWMGTRYSGLIKFNPKTREHLILNKNSSNYNFPSREIFDIQEDEFGHIWVATENGLYKIVPSTSGPEKFRNFTLLRYHHERGNYQSLSSNRISKILIDDNNHLWVGTFDRGINRSSSDLSEHDPLEFERYMAAHKDSNGLITDHILTLFEDNEQNLWIGSGGGGLFKWKPSQEKFESFSSYVSGEVIYTINQDMNDNIWLGTNRGLTRMIVKDNQVQTNYFRKENGLQGNIFNKGASYKDSSGRLYLGGNRGFNHFDPSSVKPDKYIPPVVITDVKVMNESVQPTTAPDDPLVLNHRENNISVSFAALSYSQPENNKYAALMEGLEENWRTLNADMRSLNYANLKPGTYTLKIRGSNSHGYWNPEPESLFIKVNPAPYMTWWAFSGYAVIFGCIILLFFLMERKNQNVKHALDIEHIERQKSDKLNFFKQGLFANISHEFLTPLNILSCLVDDWRHLRGAPNSKDLALAERNINRLNRLNRQFLYYSKSELEHLPLSVSAGNLNEFTQNICDNFAPLARKKNIHFYCEIHCPDSPVFFDHEKLDIVLYNLLSNAFKFTAGEGAITVRLSLSKVKKQTLASFQISDTGKGMSREQQKLIFDRFRSFEVSDQKAGGFGIGLSLTKSMVEAHKGTIELRSESGAGTTISFSLPVNRNAFEKNEIGSNREESMPATFIKSEDVEEETLLRIKNLQQSFEDKPTVLLVEDNSDFRKLMKGNLDSVFSVIEAPNGVVGYETALNKKPAVIISDVAMPAMNGIELCRKIKQNEAVSYIPVILLTARASDDERAEGYRAGADSYMTKPVNLNTLMTRMEALLEQQKRTAQRVRDNNGPILPVSGKVKNDGFLSNARGIIESNLSNPDFSVKMLADELGISSSMLYRKISESLNTNPNTFIRKMRMMKAAEMLEENNCNISEVAYKCGFKDVSYFGVTFRKDYGVTPSQYQKNRKMV